MTPVRISEVPNVISDRPAETHKVLIVSASVFPKRSGSAIVIENLVRYFSDREVAILGELGPFQRRPTRSANSPQFSYFRSRLSFFGRGSRFLSKVRWQVHSRLVDRICSIAKSQSCNYILGVYPDEYFCYAAYLASIKLDLPFSCYFHNTYLDNAAINSQRAEKIQKKLFARAEYVFVMSEGMQRHYAEQFEPGKFIPLVHTFHEFPTPEPTVFAYPTIRPAKIVLFGNFNESNLDATKRFIGSAIDDNDEIHIYSDVPKWLLGSRGLPMDSIQYHGSLSHLAFTDLIGELRKYDLIALTHGFTGEYGDVEYRTIFPTRTIPMLLAGRPILVHSPADSFLAQFFRSSNAGAVVDTPENSEIKIALQRIRNDSIFRKNLVENASKASLRFLGINVANDFRKIVGIGPIREVLNLERK